MRTHVTGHGERRALSYKATSDPQTLHKNRDGLTLTSGIVCGTQTCTRIVEQIATRRRKVWHTMGTDLTQKWASFQSKSNDDKFVNLHVWSMENHPITGGESRKSEEFMRPVRSSGIRREGCEWRPDWKLRVLVGIFCFRCASDPTGICLGVLCLSKRVFLHARFGAREAL
jgi:hypothetical protein